MIEWFSIFVLFAVTYFVAIGASIVVDKLLHRFFGRGIWPKDYFK